MADLTDKNKDELLELAKERDIEGRSTMTKDELVEALEASGTEEQSELEEQYSSVPDAPQVPGVTVPNTTVDQSHIVSPSAPPPLRSDQPGLNGNAVNPENDGDRFGIAPNVSVSRRDERLEAAKANRQAQREADKG